MPGPIMSYNKLAIVSGVFIIICILIISTTAGLHESGSKVVEKIKESAKEAANDVCNNDRPVFGKPTISDSFLRLYESIRHPIDDPSYTDASGKIHEVKEDAPWWREPLRSEILIVDIDTRVPKSMRQAALQQTYNFTCKCKLCSIDGVDPRAAMWCPKSCGGICPLPISGNHFPC